jgi:hypothetical protein
MYCLLSTQPAYKFIQIAPDLYALGRGNKVARWSDQKLVPLRQYQKRYPDYRFWIITDYELPEHRMPF